MDIDVFPNSLEYWGPNGMVFFRNVQLRWMPIQGDTRLTVALERPGASADQGDFADRIELVRSCRFVDLAIAENDWAQKPHDIRCYGVDAFVMGSDWTGHFDALGSLCEVVYLPRTEGVSSSELKLAIKNRA